MFSSDVVSSILDSAPDAMVIIDATGSILYVNRQVGAIFGYSKNELLGRSIECLLPERFRSRHVGYRRGYSASVRVRPMGSGLDLFALRRDGSEFPVEISLSPVHEGDATLVVAAIRDITERRQIQMQLREARETADRANEAKSRFLATASHDLRQPLQTLSLLNGTLRRMVKDDEVAEVLHQEEQAISAMSRLLNALLDISKLESGAIKPETTDFKVAALFEELRGEFARLAANKGLRLEIEMCADRVHSDPSLVGQVIRNLVANAIKYTREGGVRLRCLHEESCVRLEVVDTGIGIPADQLARIYDDFYQVGVPANASRDGYGLGLSIVSRIVSLLGAQLDVRSEVGKGTQFSLALPATVNGTSADAPVPEVEPAPQVHATDVSRPHVLLVEDDARVRNATRLLLKVEGFRTSAAASLEDAIELARAHPDIRLLITDYHLAADQIGPQVIEAVRGVLGAGLPAVLVTGDTSSAIRALGSDDRLRAVNKPINPDELLAILNGLLAESDVAR